MEARSWETEWGEQWGGSVPALPGPPSPLCSLQAGMVHREPGKERNKANRQRARSMKCWDCLVWLSTPGPLPAALQTDPNPHQCVCACTHVHRYRHTATHRHTVRHAHTLICLLTPMQTHTTRTHTCILTSMHTHYTHICILTPMQTHTTHTHTHTQHGSSELRC